MCFPLYNCRILSVLFSASVCGYAAAAGSFSRPPNKLQAAPPPPPSSGNSHEHEHEHTNTTDTTQQKKILAHFACVRALIVGLNRFFCASLNIFFANSSSSSSSSASESVRLVTLYVYSPYSLTFSYIQRVHRNTFTPTYTFLLHTHGQTHTHTH